MHRSSSPLATARAASLWVAVAALLPALAASPASAQTASPYAGEQARRIKALSDSEIAGLHNGHGAGFAKPAELNGYPGPAHVLELHEQLALTPQQLAATTELMSRHKARARELGAALVEAERQLDALFAERRADVASVGQATREAAEIQARLRAEHLGTHLTQTALLDDAQIRRYAVLRGYAGAPAGAAPAAASGPHVVPPAAHRHH